MRDSNVIVAGRRVTGRVAVTSEEHMPAQSQVMTEASIATHYLSAPTGDARR